MLSYRHAYHAGNFADVLKHAVLAFVLGHARGKDKPLYLLDTHAGAGVYELEAPMAAKTGEHLAGVARLANAAGAPPLLAPYLELLAGMPAGRYPGSPEIMRLMMRPTDRLELAELHPSDHAALRDRYARERRVAVRLADGLALLVARMPPPERRAVVIIDPSYEIKADYEAVVRALAKAHRRFATGIYLLWYPVVERPRIDAMMQALAASGIERQYRVELGLRADEVGRGMTSAGLVVVNPPYTLPEAADTALPWLAGRLEAKGPCVASWFVAPR